MNKERQEPNSNENKKQYETIVEQYLQIAEKMNKIEMKEKKDMKNLSKIYRNASSINYNVIKDFDSFRGSQLIKLYMLEDLVSRLYDKKFTEYHEDIHGSM